MNLTPYEQMASLRTAASAVENALASNAIKAAITTGIQQALHNNC